MQVIPARRNRLPFVLLLSLCVLAAPVASVGASPGAADRIPAAAAAEASARLVDRVSYRPGRYVPTEDPLVTCPVGHACSSFRIECRGIPPIDGWLAIGRPSEPAVGLVLLFSGRGGELWTTMQDPALVGFVATLRSMGFVTAQVRYDTDWRISAPASAAGIAHLACRAATITKHVYLTQYEPLGVDPAEVGKCGFCLIGNSGGASQVAYQLSHYGLERVIDAAVPSGGPPHSVMAKSCLLRRGEERYWYVAPQSRTVIDEGFGFPVDGPCYLSDPAYEAVWSEQSVATGGSDYFHPRTRVRLVVGDLDPTQEWVGGDYLQRLLDAGSPMVSRYVVPETEHRVFETEQGRAAWMDAILGTYPEAAGSASASR